MATPAMERYSQQMQEAREQAIMGFSRKAYPWQSQGDKKELVEVSAKELSYEIEQDIAPQKGLCVEIDAPLCRHCRLPLGKLVYANDDDEPVHGECLAQILLQTEKKEQDARQEQALAQKKSRRVEFSIGWKVESVPRNLGPLGKLGFKQIPAGAAVCLVLDEKTHTVSLAPTMEPAAAVNLEYLSLALKVRLQDGREPMFSLDAVDPTSLNSMQKKVFEPEWLAGTSIGEVMFQADYHLKELSMGEYEQPIVGMKSCFDFSDMEGFGKEWSAREWFVVRKAEIQTSDDSVLIPYVKMGVEAREQVMKGGALVDAPVTRPNHPLVKYAEQFTHHFDLIAERKSVVYHLREVAKASILAKYLVDGGVRLDSSWFDLAGEAKGAGILEIPQLWNERTNSQIQVEDGQIVNSGCSARNVMGGVDFGLDRFSVAAPRVGAMGAVAARLGPRAAARVGPMGRAPSLTFGGPARAVAQSLSGVAGVSGSLRAVAGPSAVFSGRSAMAPRLGGFAPRLSGFAASRLTTPQGVDLNLDNFSLSEPTKVSAQAVAGSWGKTEDISEISTNFFANISKESKLFKEEDKALLRDVFNPNLADRRADGEFFVAPDTSSSHVAKLRNLVKEEEAVRRRRKEHFCSAKFVMGDAGALFPSSWTSSFEIAAGQTAIKALTGPAAGGVLHPRPEYVAAPQVFDHILKSAAPIFDSVTEDGMRFRIYRVGSLEVRTTQEFDAEEVVGAAFSIRSATAKVASLKIADGELIVKATEYVEHAPCGCHFYVLLETEEGNTILTEMLSDKVSWQENAADVDDRNSLAKVVRSEECSSGLSVAQVRQEAAKIQGQRYAQRAFECATAP